MYGPVSWSPMTPHHTFTEKRLWYLLSAVPWGLLRSHKWEFLEFLILSLVKWAATLQVFQNQQPLQIGLMCTHTLLHFLLRISSGIKPWSTDLNRESLANITHRRNVSVPHPAHSAPWTCGHMCRWIDSNSHRVRFVTFFHRRGPHKVNTREELLQLIFSAARSINYAAVLRKVTSSLVTRSRKCIQADGGHFEELAWVMNGESVTVHLTTYLNKCTMLLFLF